MSASSNPHFSKILIANRGEIACRVIKTANKLGIKTVAIYSEADIGALHVAQADESYCIGPAPAPQSYLNIDKIIAVARQCGARAIHPGYGFLSENAAFAGACAEAGIVFIGPPAEAIAAMGSKSEAKVIMERAGVPTVPGYHGSEQSDAALKDAALNIGFPLLIKAAMGGGGKGMRVVDDAMSLESAIAGAKREAEKSFGSAELLLEKYIPFARHVEVQIFFDRHGNGVHLYDRDCSIQRRHQKIIEEAPAPDIRDAVRRKMYQAALNAGRAINYEGAGTVEFLLAPDGEFYFMEMNTRLQVEHPVTEMITGQDLVEWQLRVAAGEPLPVRQEHIMRTGYAVEVRIYAENPDNDYLPSTGTLSVYRPPGESTAIRLDSGVKAGDEISSHYDPMIAKLIARGDTREKAIAQLSRALSGYWIDGVHTNVHFLTRLLGDEAFHNAELCTHFLELRQQPPAVTDPLSTALLAAVATYVDARCKHPFAGFRNNLDALVCGRFLHDGYWIDVSAGILMSAVYATVQMQPFANIREKRHNGGDQATVTIEFALLSATADSLLIRCRHQNLRFFYQRQANGIALFHQGRSVTLRMPAVTDFGGQENGWRRNGSLDCSAPMTGTVVKVLVEVGQAVAVGCPLIVLEAMKMEHTLTASRNANVECIFCREGDRVSEQQALIHLSDSEC